MPTSQQETWSHWNHTRSGAGYPLSQAQRCSQGSFPWGRAGCWSWPRLPQLGISWLHFLHSQPHSLNSHQMAGSLSFSPDSHSPFPYLGKTICCFLWWLLPFSSKIWKSISFAFRKWNIWCCLRLKKKILLPLIIQLCIVKESLPNYQLFYIDSNPMCACTRLWFHYRLNYLYYCQIQNSIKIW